jgi:hypothetical protein
MSPVRARKDRRPRKSGLVRFGFPSNDLKPRRPRRGLSLFGAPSIRSALDCLLFIVLVLVIDVFPRTRTRNRNRLLSWSCAPRRGDPVNSPGWRHGFMCRYPGYTSLLETTLKGWHKASPLWDPVRVLLGRWRVPRVAAHEAVPPPGAIHRVTPSGCARARARAKTRAKADYEHDYELRARRRIDYEHDYELRARRRIDYEHDYEHEHDGERGGGGNFAGGWYIHLAEPRFWTFQ